MNMATLVPNAFIPKVSRLLAETPQLEQYIRKVASFSIDEASDSNESAEFIAVTRWKFDASQLLVRILVHFRGLCCH